MSKQSEAKQKQGFTKNNPTCINCKNFTCKIEKVQSKWSDQVWEKETELRCSKGLFKVMKTTWCNEHEFKTENK